MNILWKHALRSARANKGQSAVIIATVVMVTLMIFVAFSVNGLFYNIIMVENNRTAQGADMLLGNAVGGDPFSSSKVRDMLNGDQRVQYAEYYFKYGSLLRTQNASKEILVEATNISNEYLARHGLKFEKKLETAPAYVPVIINARMAASIKADVGDTIEIFSVTQNKYIKHTVTYIAENKGIFSAPQSLNVLVDINSLGSMGLVTGVYIKFNASGAYEEYLARFQEELPTINCGEADDRTRAAEIAASNTLLYQVGMVFILGLMTLILYTSFIIITKKRLQEMVLFKAAGATPGATTAVMLAEAAVYGGIGSAAGVTLGAILLRIVVRLFLPAVTSAITYTFLQFAVGLIGGLAVCLAAAYFPAAHAAKKTVRELTSAGVKAAKFKSPWLSAGLFAALAALVVAVNYASGFFIIVLTVLILPVLAAFIAAASPYLIKGAGALWNKFQIKGAAGLAAFSLKRNAATHTVALLLASVIAFSFMCVSVMNLVILAVTPYNTRFSGDLAVRLVEDMGLSELREIAADLSAIDGTREAVYFRQYVLEVSTDDGVFNEVNAYGVGSAAAARHMSTDIADAVLARFLPGTVIINEEVARMKGLRVGDKISLSRTVVDATGTYREFVDGFFEVIGVENTVTEYDRVVFLNIADAKINAKPLAGDTVFLASADGSVPIEGLFSAYRAHINGTGRTAYVLFFNDWAFAAVSGLEGVQSILRILQIAVIAVAFLSIANIIIVTYFDRKNEYKTYRFCGLSEGDFMRLAGGEAAVLAFAGGASGVIASFIINRIMPILGMLVEKYLRYPLFPPAVLAVSAIALAVFAAAWLLLARASKKQLREAATFNERILGI